MNPLPFSPQNIIVQGISGTHGAFHTREMVKTGTNIIAGTSPTKAGTNLDGIPIFKTVREIQTVHQIDASIIFVPAPFAKGALYEAIDAGIPLIVCITEGIPIHDMLQVKKRLERSNSVLVGPNCPGLIGPGGIKLGIIPYQFYMPGSVGIVSRSGTLTYEAAAELTASGIGQRYILGIGGDQIHGLGFRESLELFENDPTVDTIVMIGEIGGREELVAAEYIKSSITKPVYTYVTGLHAPSGVQLGHAGAILKSEEESASYKLDVLGKAGAVTARSVIELIDMIKQRHGIL